MPIRLNATAIATLAMTTAAIAQITPYSQNFETLNPADPSALANDGWLVGANVYDSAGNFIYNYFTFPAPTGGSAFSAIDQGQGGPNQGARQLSIYNDYNNADHNNPNIRIEANVFQEFTIGAADVGMEWRFSFDAKAGNIASGTNNSTAVAFIKIIDPNSNFAQTGGDQITLTDTPTDWRFYSLSTTIETAQVGQIFQIGFWSVASNFEDSGVFYDNLNLAASPSVIGLYARPTVTDVSVDQGPTFLGATPTVGDRITMQIRYTASDFVLDAGTATNARGYNHNGPSLFRVDFGNAGFFSTTLNRLGFQFFEPNRPERENWTLTADGMQFGTDTWRADVGLREFLTDQFPNDDLPFTIDLDAFLADTNGSLNFFGPLSFMTFLPQTINAEFDAASFTPIGQVASFEPYTPRDLTPNMIVDEARTGGDDIDFITGSEVFLAWEVDAGWTPGEQASITGLALPIQTSNSDRGTLTLSFYGLSGGPNPNQFDGEASETFLGSRTLEFIGPGPGADVFAGLFDEPLNFTTDATGFAVRLQSTGLISLKRIGNGGTNPTASEQIRIDNGLRAGGGGNYYALSWAGQSLLTDLNADGETNFFDTLTLLQDFDAGPADYNGDAFTNNTDLLDYLLALDLIPSPGTR